jgi:hypothetical protein
MGMLVIVKYSGVFQCNIFYIIEVSTGDILKENQTRGDEFSFQQDNNLNHKDTSTLELPTKKTVNVPEWPSYNFDVNLLENLSQVLKMVV